MPCSFGVVVSVPAHRMSMRHPSKKLSNLSVGIGLDDKMPMIGGKKGDGLLTPFFVSTLRVVTVAYATGYLGSIVRVSVITSPSLI